MANNTSVNKILRLMCIYSVTVSFLYVIALKNLTKTQENIKYNETDVPSIKTEYVYIQLEQDGTEKNTAEQSYTVREYMGKIGVFDTDGVLIKLIDVNIKTLPEADRRLLEEGIEVIGKKQLNSIMEDYLD